MFVKHSCNLYIYIYNAFCFLKLMPFAILFQSARDLGYEAGKPRLGSQGWEAKAGKPRLGSLRAAGKPFFRHGGQDMVGLKMKTQ